MRRRTEVCNEAVTPYGQDLSVVLILFSALSFLAYGTACFFSSFMRREFDRYRLGEQRTLVGGLQLCAAVGLLAGLSQPWMGRAAAAGLALMMLVAVGVRIKIKDTLLQTLPALFHLALNAYLSLAAF
jgi:DoxX-like family